MDYYSQAFCYSTEKTPLSISISPLDALPDVRPIVAPDGVEHALHDSHGGTAPALGHLLNDHPLVFVRVVALDRVEALSGHPVVAAHCIEVAVEDGHTHTGATGAHGGNVGPHLVLCMEEWGGGEFEELNT